MKKNIMIALCLFASPLVLAEEGHDPHKHMDHSKMDHGQHNDQQQEQRIPVSDGSAQEYIPIPFPGAMHMEDDPVLTKVIIDRLETHFVDDGDNPLVLEAEAWVGKDLNKLWFKTEVERVGNETEEAELQVLYSRAISAYWDVQIGARKDFEPQEREWLAFGVQGLAPYFFETDIAVFVGNNDRTAARISSEYEAMLTQKTVLSPEIELNFYGQSDREIEVGSGLSDATVGLRLLYEVKREITPYVGITWSKKFGETADFAEDEDEEVETLQFVAGIRIWF